MSKYFKSIVYLVLKVTTFMSSLLSFCVTFIINRNFSSVIWCCWLDDKKGAQLVWSFILTLWLFLYPQL